MFGGNAFGQGYFGQGYALSGAAVPVVGRDAALVWDVRRIVGFDRIVSRFQAFVGSDQFLGDWLGEPALLWDSVLRVGRDLAMRFDVGGPVGVDLVLPFGVEVTGRDWTKRAQKVKGTVDIYR